MDWKEEVEKLRGLMKGAYIEDVEFSGRDESLCDFVLRRDGKKYSFTLFATDLGFWTGSLKNFKGHHRELQDIWEEIHEHNMRVDPVEGCTYKCFDDPFARTVGFECACGKRFEIGLSDLKESPYCSFLTTVEGREKVASVLGTDYMWSPEHLKNILEETDRN